MESILLLTAVSGGSGRRDGPFRSVVELETISAGPRPSSVDIRHVPSSAPTSTCQCACRFSPPPCRLLFRLSLHRRVTIYCAWRSPFSSREPVWAQRQGVRLVSGRTSVRVRFLFRKVVVCGHCLVTLSLTMNEILKRLSSLAHLNAEVIPVVTV